MSEISLSPFYHSSVNEITKPGSLVFVSHYFVDRWMPELGPNATAILICLRSHCYYNRATSELRDQVQLSLPEIAKECNISYKTVQREIAGNKALQKFIRVRLEYAHGKTPTSLRRDANSYQVAMDDPVHPEDDQKLIEIVSKKAAAQDKGAAQDQREQNQRESEAKERARRKPLGQSVLTAGSEDNLSVPLGQIVPTPGDNLSLPPGQIVLALKDSSLSQDMNPLEFAAVAAPEVLASPSPERKEPEGKLNTPWTFDLLSDANRAPWLDKAEAELRENFGVAVWAKTKEKAKQSIRAQRAANLYLKSFDRMAKGDDS